MADPSIGLRWSLRTKLVIVCIVVQVIMLGISFGNSLRLLNDTLERETQARVNELSPLLNAAFSNRLFERDHATIMEVMGQLLGSTSSGLRYIVIYDDQSTVYAKNGLVDTDQMPALDGSVSDSLLDGVHDEVSQLTLSNEVVGEVRFGLSIASFLSARDNIISQELLLGALNLVFICFLLGIAGYLLTRHINTLAKATLEVSTGDYGQRVRIESRDEIGVLARNFNRMGEAIGDRIRELHQTEMALFAEKERAQVTLHSIGDAVITTDMQGKVETLNPVAEKLTGWLVAEVVGRPVEEIFQISDENSTDPVENPVLRSLHDRKVDALQNQCSLIDRYGNSRSIEHTTSPIRDRQGAVVGAVLIFHDVSEARRMSEQLQHQATHDSLTGLFNREEFERRLESALDDALDHENVHALCYMDLDQFKVVNDTCGHIAGDELLRQLGVLLKEQIRHSDVLARLGGDEFGMLIMNCPLERVHNIAESARDSISQYHFVWDNQSFQVGVSIGVVSVRAGSGSVSDILAAADVACYLAKEQGRNCVRFYECNDKEHERRQGEMQWSSRIASALRENRFALHYQKIIPLEPDTVSLLDCELLVRMVDEDENLVMPGVFIPAAERYRLMAEIDRWVIHAALHAPEINRVSPAFQSFSINISGQSLSSENFLAYVLREIDSSGIEPHRICFEITETAAIANLSRATEIIDGLRAKGCLFALDDFGSGLSSFAYLKNLSVDFLKIDGAFVRDMIDDQTDQAMVQAIHQVGHAMGIKTIAEFIESSEIQTMLQQIGIDYGQGYGIHKPAPLAMHPLSTDRARRVPKDVATA